MGLTDMFEADANSGNENIGQDDLAIPFLKALSKQDDIFDTREDIRPGDILNTVTGRVYSAKDGPLTVIPCAYQRKYIKWSPRGEGSSAPLAIYDLGDVLPKTVRDEATNKDMCVDENGTYLEETHQHFVCVLNDDGTVSQALIAMKSTNLKKSRKWNSMISERMMTRSDGSMFSPPRFASTFLLGTESQTNTKGTWYGWTIDSPQWLADANVYGQAKRFSDAVSAGDVIVKHTDDEGGEGPDEGGEGPDGSGPKPF